MNFRHRNYNTEKERTDYLFPIYRTIIKMKLFNKICLLILTVTVSLTFVSCSGGNKSVESEDEISLKFIIPGKEDMGSNDRVFESFNNYISDKLPGVRVEFEVVNKYNYGDILNMYLNTDKTFDIAWNCDSFQPYLIDINRNHYKVLDKLIQAYGKDILRSFPKECIDDITVSNHIFFIPTVPYTLNNKSTPFLIIPKKYAGYFDVDSFIYEISNNGLGEAAYEIISDYLMQLESDKLLENGADYIELSNILPYVNYETVMSTDGLLGFSHSSPTVITELEKSKEYELFGTYREYWLKCGYIHEDYMITGKHNLVADNKYVLSAASGFIDKSGIRFTLADDISDDKLFIPLDTAFYRSEYIQNGMVFISTDSKYPEKAMELLNLFYKDNMLYKILSEGLDENGNKIDNYSMYPNILPTSTINSPQAKIENVIEVEYTDEDYVLSSFVPGISQLNQLFSKYNNSEYYKEIISEINEQADLYRKSEGK